MKIKPATLVLWLALFLIVSCADKEPALVNDQTPPEFTLERLDGKTISFPTELAGKVVAIRFWADWCPFCKTEMKAIEPVYQQYADQGLVILAVNVRQDVQTARKFIEKLGISYNTLLDSDGAVARDYGVIALPSTFFIDRNGSLSSRLLGEASGETFEKIIQPLL